MADANNSKNEAQETVAWASKNAWDAFNEDNSPFEVLLHHVNVEDGRRITALRAELDAAKSQLARLYGMTYKNRCDEILVHQNETLSIELSAAKRAHTDMTNEVMRIGLRHLDNHQGDVYHIMQSLKVKFGAKWDGKLTEPARTARSRGETGTTK